MADRMTCSLLRAKMVCVVSALGGASYVNKGLDELRPVCQGYQVYSFSLIFISIFSLLKG